MPILASILPPSETAVVPLGFYCSYPIRVRDEVGRQTKPGPGLEHYRMKATKGEAVLPTDWSLHELILWSLARCPRLSLSPRQGRGLGIKLVLELWGY